MSVHSRYHNSDNGHEYKEALAYTSAQACRINQIKQKFARPTFPQTNEKTERAI